MECINCGDKLNDESVRWAFDEPYCDEWWNENYDDDAPENPEVTILLT